MASRTEQLPGDPRRNRAALRCERDYWRWRYMILDTMSFCRG